MARAGRGGARPAPDRRYRPGQSEPGDASEIDLLRDAEGIVDLDAQIANGAFQLPMAEQGLDRSQIASLAADLSCLRAPHRMRPIGRTVKARIRLGHSATNPAGLPCPIGRLSMVAGVGAMSLDRLDREG